MVEAIPVVFATEQRFLEGHVEILCRPKLVTPVALPGEGSCHGLTTEEIIGRTVVQNIECLLLAIIRLFGECQDTVSAGSGK